MYYDWASGEQDPTAGHTDSTFNQLFPFGHYYFGYLDLVGRQNIEDWNVQLACFPTKWITAGIQNHRFELVSSRDALYNAGGVALRRDPTGRAGRDVGDEIDVFANFHLTTHQDLLIGFSELFEGSFLQQTNPAGNPVGSPELYYVQYSFKW
jgi:hypothetical protein